MKKIIFLLAALLVSVASIGQITTATISGKVTDDLQNELVAATVVAVHTPSGTLYGTTTLENGKFNLPNLRVGGPYKIEVSYIGYETQVKENIFLSLGQKFNVDMILSSASVTLEGVTVVGTADPILNGERTGSSTNINVDQIQKLPSISRAAKDYYRLTPSASGNSFNGRNDKMNNFMLDGSIFNNPFGLDAATPGSQTNAQPVSLDAIDQIQVDIAPYDVTMSGFTGAAINAVTKSGTNEFKGSVFAFYRNQDLTGSKVAGESIIVPDLTHLQTGFSLGGPIIKNKLFFFINAEIERRGDLGSNYVAARPGLSGDNVSRVSAADLELVSSVLKENYNYETGAYEDFKHNTINNKGMFKLDYNINEQHTLTATYNFLDATLDKPAHPEAIGRRGPDQTTLQFYNSGYQIRNLLHSGIIELKSLFGNKFSNNLQAGVTAFRDSRDPFSEPFPTINIAKDGIRYIVAGHEPFSIHNRLYQDVYQVTNNFNMYFGDHTVTVGGSFEKFLFDNSFNLGVYPGVFDSDFESVSAFVAAVESGEFDANVNTAKSVYEANGGDDGVEGEGWALAETNVGQLAFYAQDEWAVNDDFTITLGLRVDKPLYFDTKTKIQENIDRNFDYAPEIEWYNNEGEKVQIDHTELPDSKILWSPRLGFNYNASGDNSTIIRGGTGLFSGRFPFVWVGNQVANPNWWFYCTTAPDFNFPQVWRSNIGLDKKLPGDFVLSFDAVYSKDLKAMMVRNWGLNQPTGNLQGVDNRAIYTFTDKAIFEGLGFPLPVNGYVFTNTDVGRTINASIQLQKRWTNGLYTSLAYDYLDSKDASSIPAEISGDAFDRNPALGSVNEPMLSYSRYGHKHRIIGSGYKKFEYGNGRFATTISMFFEYLQGGRYSYTYSGDINGDGSGLNDLIYIPTENELASMNFTNEDQRAAYGEFIEQDEYLSANRGSYAGKYDILSPWYSSWDLRVLQDFNFSFAGRTNTVQLSMDVLNIGNLLNSNWGVRQNPTNTQPVGVSVNEGVPTYSFDSSLADTYTNDFSLLSRWQIQFGLRYIF
jgi:hypothetical protein